ncbi:MAG: hypothetical protein ACTSR2_14705 [Candidatus Hodarchaeales archaeon]
MKNETPIQPLSQSSSINSQLQLMLAIELLNYNGPIFSASSDDTNDSNPVKRSAS